MGRGWFSRGREVHAPLPLSSTCCRQRIEAILAVVRAG